MNCVIVAASTFLYRLGNGAYLHHYKENKNVVMGIKCHGFSEKRANGFCQRNFRHTQINSMRKGLWIKQNAQPMITFCWLNYLMLPIIKSLPRLVIILWQVIFISGRLNCKSIYMCISLWIWELKWNNKIYEIFLYRHLFVKMSMCKYEYVDTEVGT